MCIFRFEDNVDFINQRSLQIKIKKTGTCTTTGTYLRMEGVRAPDIVRATLTPRALELR